MKIDVLDLIQAEISRADKDGNYEGALYRLRAAFSPPMPAGSPHPSSPVSGCLAAGVDCDRCPIPTGECPGEK
jgi:hypothetical protein